MKSVKAYVNVAHFDGAGYGLTAYTNCNIYIYIYIFIITIIYLEIILKFCFPVLLKPFLHLAYLSTNQTQHNLVRCNHRKMYRCNSPRASVFKKNRLRPIVLTGQLLPGFLTSLGHLPTIGHQIQDKL